jgi:hypothetical protein
MLHGATLPACLLPLSSTLQLLLTGGSACDHTALILPIRRECDVTTPFGHGRSQGGGSPRRQPLEAAGDAREPSYMNIFTICTITPRLNRQKSHFLATRFEIVGQCIMCLLPCHLFLPGHRHKSEGAASPIQHWSDNTNIPPSMLRPFLLLPLLRRAAHCVQARGGCMNTKHLTLTSGRGHHPHQALAARYQQQSPTDQVVSAAQGT